MQRKYMEYVCICVCMSVPWEESTMKNRTEAARESVNTELFACLRVLLCVHRQNGSIFYKRMYCVSSVCVCVCVSEWQWSIDLTALPEGAHTSLSLLQYPLLIDCFQHRSGDVSQSVTLLISSQSQHTWVVLTVPTGHWWFMKSVLWPHFYSTTSSYWPTCRIKIFFTVASWCIWGLHISNITTTTRRALKQFRVFFVSTVMFAVVV